MKKSAYYKPPSGAALPTLPTLHSNQRRTIIAADGVVVKKSANERHERRVAEKVSKDLAARKMQSTIKKQEESMKSKDLNICGHSSHIHSDKFDSSDSSFE